MGFLIDSHVYSPSLICTFPKAVARVSYFSPLSENDHPTFNQHFLLEFCLNINVGVYLQATYMTPYPLLLFMKFSFIWRWVHLNPTITLSFVSWKTCPWGIKWGSNYYRTSFWGFTFTWPPKIFFHFSTFCFCMPSCMFPILGFWLNSGLKSFLRLSIFSLLLLRFHSVLPKIYSLHSVPNFSGFTFSHQVYQCLESKFHLWRAPTTLMHITILPIHFGPSRVYNFVYLNRNIFNQIIQFIPDSFL